MEWIISFRAHTQEQVNKTVLTIILYWKYSIKDKVFLLSDIEANQYFESDEDRVVQVTEFAKATGVNTHYSNLASWWLRTKDGNHLYNPYAVSYTGVIFNNNEYLDYKYDGIRPVIRINVR